MASGKETTRTSYPTEFPILTGRDFCKRRWHENSKHKAPDSIDDVRYSCLEGWCLVTFVGKLEWEAGWIQTHEMRTSPYYRKLQQAVKEVIESQPKLREQLGEEGLGTGGTLVLDIPEVNDAKCVPKTVLARIWNRFGALLGYTEGNPEATK